MAVSYNRTQVSCLTQTSLLSWTRNSQSCVSVVQACVWSWKATMIEVHVWRSNTSISLTEACVWGWNATSAFDKGCEICIWVWEPNFVSARSASVALSSVIFSQSIIPNDSLHEKPKMKAKELLPTDSSSPLLLCMTSMEAEGASVVVKIWPALGWWDVSKLPRGSSETDRTWHYFYYTPTFIL